MSSDGDETEIPSPVTGGPVTISITRRVMPGQRDAYDAILRELLAETNRFEGFVSGLLERERERVAGAFAAAGLRVEREVVDGEWAALLLRG